MKRRLIVMRHAEAAMNSADGSDHARPLTPRGRSDAPRVARALLDRGWRPEAVLSSDSRRTRETWEGMAPELDAPPQPSFTRALYLAGLDTLWEEVHGVASEVETLLVLGHNPGWEHAVYRLSGQPEAMAPANAALLVGSGDTWPEALEGRWERAEVVRL